MRYLFIGFILLAFSGCGSNSKKAEETDIIIKPVSPTPKDSSKQPPSIPDI